MIHPDVIFEHVDINQARRFVDLSAIAQPHPRALYVLHDKGKVLKAWDSQKGKVSVDSPLTPSGELAEELKRRHGVEEVQLIDRDSYHEYLKQALDLKAAQELTGYDFKERAKKLKTKQGNGFLIHPPRENYEYYHYVDRTRQFVAQKLKPDCVFLLGVHTPKEWWTSVMTVFTGGQITYLTTFEYFPVEKLSTPDSKKTHEELLKTAAQAFQKPSLGMFLPQEMFEEFGRNQWRGLGATPLLQSQ
ncbi:MAG TPA: hypothetical protein VJ873_11065 [bacterium]|nr:hypothetical protein [bacterium]